ncbi:MAG TPA: ABC transporter ATP-binding protein [Eoetvoesiella sp.]|jgi:simple sugar transport system ATP-binding protein|uniref:ABC transporter ATP-binding protein n=1 Tax=Eoetvoesiella sp. TaxID=1966355 RepID=UPI002C20B985|nr:ABC transporter ATP-binding protein [Eoetvoesiella sp.]HWK59950.1 ABC transporter ATP-binding protein [Eoetvoesiella sp.]
MALPDQPLLELEGVTKRFGRLVANDGVGFSVGHGEVVGVLGENGAGKSTLMNIISGLITPDEGIVRFDGKAMHFDSPRAAAEAGVGMVHQHFKLVGALTVAENLALGDPRWGRGRLRLERLKADILPIAERLGMSTSFERRVDRLTVGEQQRVEIMKVLSRKPKLLILDEPTAVLSREERPALFQMVAELAGQGTAVLIISHKLEDILESCRRVVVMRLGKVVSVSDVGGKSRDDLIRLLVGDDLPTLVPRTQSQTVPTRLLSVDSVSVRRSNGTLALDGVSFELYPGEVLALCGVDGNGQTELVQMLAGLLAPDSGSVRYWFDAGGGYLGPERVRKGGVSHIPEDRLKDGVLAASCLADNYLLTQLNDTRFNKAGWLVPRVLRQVVERAIDDFAIRAPGTEALMSQLSGGNQQKLVLARELANDPKVVIAAHPTRGLDVQTIAFVNNQLLLKRTAGAGVFLSSADLNEVWQVADRIMVLSAGRLHGPVRLSDTSLQEVGHWMTGR